jgi:TolB-like protein/tRNA A-37 threonylcarbamoyl transferase component Bud32/tetratricopeptide (TPR) repeat protein
VPDSITHLTATLASRFRLEGELGRGATATVYLACDLALDRQVAVKVLHPELAASLGPERFLREIEIAGQLTHPNILPVLGSGEADGLLYYVTPYLAGGTLRQRLRRETQLPVADALRIAREVAAALGHAHRAGIVHRDIKPENILLNGEQALVADFGVARAIESAAGDRMTETGLAVGTATYMSPEQASPGGRVDGRSDLYSLGCVLYEMLAGEPPFTGSGPRSIVAKHMLTPIPDVRVTRPSVPEPVRHVIARAMAKVPADRFGTAEELARRLESAAAERPDWRRPLRLAAAGVGTLALLAAPWVAYRWLQQRAAETPGDGPRIAVLYFDADSSDDAARRLADGITEELIYELSGVDRFQVVTRSGVETFRGRRAPIDTLAASLGVNTVVDGRVQRWGSGIRVRAQLIDAGSDSYLDSLSLEQGRITDSAGFARDAARRLAAGLRRSMGRVARIRLAGAGSHDPRARSLAERAQRIRDDAQAIAASPHAEDLPTARAALRRADSLLALAQQLDPAWGAPAIDRGWVAFERAMLSAGRAHEAALYQAMRLAEAAVQRLPGRPRALELRGAVRARLAAELQQTPGAADPVALAERDLRAALDQDSSLVRGWEALANLLWTKGSIAEAQVASRRALRLDSYQSEAPGIYQELFYDDLMLGNYAQAGDWCRRGQVAFPDRWRFVECALTLMRHDPDAEPDADSAWALVRTLERLDPPDRARAEGRAYHVIYRRVVAATISARAGQPEVARAELARARRAVQGDPTLALDLDYDESVLRMALGERDRARTLLESYAAGRPLAREQLARDPLVQPWEPRR